MTAREDTTVERTARTIAPLVGVAAVLFGYLNLGAIEAQSARASIWWSLASVTGVFAPAVALGLASVRSSARVIRTVALVGACSMPLVLITAATLFPRSGNESPWPLQVTALGTTAAALAMRPAWVVLDVTVTAVLVAVVRTVTTTAPLGPIPVQDALYGAMICAVLAALVMGTLRAARAVDVCADAATTEAMAEAEERARADQRVQANALTHDHLLTTLVVAGRSPVVSPGLALEAAAALAELERLESSGNADTFVRASTLVDRLRSEAAATAPVARFVVSAVAYGPPVPSAVADAVVQALGEALRNALRHAPDATLAVLATIVEGGLLVDVMDDGPGFDLDAVPPDRYGVHGSIIGRLQAVGGSAEVRTGPDAGTIVRLRWSP